MGGLSQTAALKNWRFAIMKALIKNIKVTERIRKEITKIEELAADISAHGLINPITVMSVDDDEFRLLAGLRRLKAVESMGLVEIDVNIVAPADAEAELWIEISENEQREDFTFSEKMDYARLVKEIEKVKAKERMSLGGKGGLKEGTPLGAEVQRGETSEFVADKIGMGKTNFKRAEYIVKNAPDEIIDELDRGERKIRSTYDELKAKEKATKVSAETVDEDIPDVNEPADMEKTSDLDKKANTAEEKNIKASKTTAINKSSASPNNADKWRTVGIEFEKSRQRPLRQRYIAKVKRGSAYEAKTGRVYRHLRQLRLSQRP
jgi:ParB family chromosome partitioning protein